MAELAETFESEMVRQFSQGPEKDTSIEVDQAVTSLLDSMPQAFLDWLDEQDPFTKKSILEQLEVTFKDAVNSATEVGEDAERYRTAYAEYGWQYDETALVVAPEIMQTMRHKQLSRIATVLHALEDKKSEVSDES